MIKNISDRISVTELYHAGKCIANKSYKAGCRNFQAAEEKTEQRMEHIVEK